MLQAAPRAREDRLTGLLGYIETALVKVGRIFIHPEAVGEDRQLRAFLALLVLVLAPPLFLVGLDDLLAGRTLEGVFALVLVFVLLATLAVARWAEEVRWGLRLVVVSVMVALGVQLALGGGQGLAFLWLYFFPAAMLYVFGTREGAFWAALPLATSAPLFFTDLGFDYGLETGVRFVMTYVIVTLLAYGLELSRRRLVSQLKQEKEHLQAAMAEVRTLSGMLPLCAWCRKVRDDRGYWSGIEEYLKEHSGMEVSHGLCPECLAKLRSGVRRDAGEGA